MRGMLKLAFIGTGNDYCLFVSRGDVEHLWGVLNFNHSCANETIQNWYKNAMCFV